MSKAALVGLVLLGAAGAAWAFTRRGAGQGEPDQAQPDPAPWNGWEGIGSTHIGAWTASLIADTASTMQHTYDTPATLPGPDAQIRAMLDTIAAAEGTAGPDGYRTLFGGALFTGYGDHPRVAKQFTTTDGRKLWTSAAGRYQFMAVSPIPGGGSTKVDTWDRLKRKLGLPDFSPDSQDRAAIELIREAGALDDVQAGRFDRAVSKLAGTWASLPGAGYSQPERKLAWLADRFTDAGGALA